MVSVPVSVVINVVTTATVVSMQLKSVQRNDTTITTNTATDTNTHANAIQHSTIPLNAGVCVYICLYIPRGLRAMLHTLTGRSRVNGGTSSYVEGLGLTSRGQHHFSTTSRVDDSESGQADSSRLAST